MAVFGIDYPRAALLALLVVTNVALVAAVSTSSVAYGPYNGEWDGSSDVRAAITEAGAEPVIARTTAPYTSGTPARTVAIVPPGGDNYTRTDLARLNTFVRRGGTLVVAAERTRTNRLLGRLDARARIDGRPLRDEQHNVRSPQLPIARNVSGNHSLVDGVDGLALNRGTVIRPNSTRANGTTTRNVEVLVRTSGISYLDANGNGTLDTSEPVRSYPVVTMEAIGDGRVLVISDGSVLTNAMLDRADNRAFVRNLAAAHDRVLLDYSQGPALPPLTYALLVLRDTPLLQVALGLVGIGGVLLWAQWPAIGTGVLAVARRRTRDAPADAPRLDETEIAAVLAREHPSWDDERVERVTKAIRRQREDEGQ